MESGFVKHYFFLLVLVMFPFPFTSVSRRQGSGPAFVDSSSFNIRAHGGNLDIRNTKIFSWDIEAGAYDEDPTDGRP